MHLWLGMPILLLALSACDRTGHKSSVTQVAVQVNGEEITIHQVNRMLARAPNVTPAVTAQVKRQILERLVNQELARQQAVEKKLDRTPHVVQAIESAKAEIVASAYLEQVAASQPKPTEIEARKYYQEHPELFSKRRIFHVDEINVRPDAAVGERLQEQISKTRSIRSVAAWLKSQGVQFAQSERIVAAEEVPLASLRTLYEATEGEVQIYQAPGRISVFRVVSAKPAPLDESVAIPRIQQFLFRQRANEAVAKEVKRLRDTAEITYLGEFAADAQDKAMGTSPAVSTTPPENAPAHEAPSPAVEQNFDKGLRGLRQ